MENFKLRGSNFCTSSGLLTATGAETVYDTTVTITYCINGKAATKTAVTDGATPTTDFATGSAITLTASKSRCVVWGLIDGGGVRVDGGVVRDKGLKLEAGTYVVQVGKRKFARVVLG